MDRKFLLIIFISEFYLIKYSNETIGIEIPTLNSSNACSNAQPLVVNESYGYIQTPGFDNFHYYPSNLSCSWLFTAKENNTFSLKFLSFELDLALKAGLYLYNGLNASYSQIKKFSGILRHFPEFISPGNSLFMHFIGISEPKNVGFIIYFKQKPIPVQCESSQIRCRNGYKCVEIKHYCDGVDDCEDGTDEEKCPITLNELNFQNGCGNPQIKPLETNLRIVGGYAAKPGSWPWMVDLRIINNEPDGHTCGASILNRQWVVSAAHCFINYPKLNEWRIHFGKYQKLVSDSHEMIRYIDSIYIHPDFKGGQTDSNDTGSDLVLIRLNAPLPKDNPFISAVCLPEFNQELIPKDMLWVTGWGLTSDTGNELVLKQTQVPIISNEICRKWMPYLYIGSTQMCAGFEEGGQDSCQGDSGGPLVRKDPKTKNYRLFGIVSNGGDCGGKKQAGIYTKVSHFVLWIYSMIFEHKSYEFKLLDSLLKNWQRIKNRQ